MNDTIIIIMQQVIVYLADYIADAEVGCTSGDVRLVGPKIWNTTSGRVEICIDSEWTSVCNKSWDDKDAMVACRQMRLDYESES